jgi:DNA-binding MarR family transcriptional regulator
MSFEHQVLTRLSAGALSYLVLHPEASCTGVRNGLGMRHLSQASRLLHRLEEQGLVENQSGSGRESAWRITPAGLEALNEALNDQSPEWTAVVPPAPTPAAADVAVNPASAIPAVDPPSAIPAA